MTLVQRFKYRAACLLVSAVLRAIGCTLRVEYSFEPDSLPEGTANFNGFIFSFWHRCVLPATYLFRHRRLAVMTSQSNDGEYIARVIEHFGYIAVRGSSSRGGMRALGELRKILENGGAAVFTIDGPRGPRYVAKRGPVLLGTATGAPIVPFYVAVQRAWILNSWDRFMIPKPFSRVHVALGSMIRVPAGLDENGIEHYRSLMQAALERVTREAEEKLGIPPL